MLQNEVYIAVDNFMGAKISGKACKLRQRVMQIQSWPSIRTSQVRPHPSHDFTCLFSKYATRISGIMPVSVGLSTRTIYSGLTMRCPCILSSGIQLLNSFLESIHLGILLLALIDDGSLPASLCRLIRPYPFRPYGWLGNFSLAKVELLTTESSPGKS